MTTKTRLDRAAAAIPGEPEPDPYAGIDCSLYIRWDGPTRYKCYNAEGERIRTTPEMRAALKARWAAERGMRRYGLRPAPLVVVDWEAWDPDAPETEDADGEVWDADEGGMEDDS